MTTALPIRVTRATAADLRWIPRLIAHAFHDMAPSMWLVPDEPSRHQVLAGNFDMWCRHALTHGHIDVIDTNACAVYLHHDHRLVPAPVYYGHRLQHDCGERAEQFQLLDQLFEQHHPQDRGPHHYLAFLAAEPRNTGMGDALLAHHERGVLDPEGLGGFLIAGSADSLRLYERHNYQPAGEVLRLPGDTVEMYPMWRRPRPSAALGGP